MNLANWSVGSVSNIAMSSCKQIYNKIIELKLKAKSICDDKLLIYVRNSNSGVEINKTVNQYVIYAKSFYESYHTANFYKCDLSFGLYLDKLREFSKCIGFRMTQKYAEESKSFFDKAKNLWEDKLMTINSDGEEISELLGVMRKVVASQLWKLNKNTIVPFDEVSNSILELSTESVYEEYMNCYIHKFDKLWADKYAMNEFISGFYAYNQWNISEMSMEYLRQYSLDSAWFSKIRQFVHYLLSWVNKEYTPVNEYLYSREDNETLAPSCSDRSRKYSIYYYKNETKAYLYEAAEFIVRTLRLDIPLNFVINNSLRFLSIGEFIARKFCSGVYVVYAKGTNIAAVLINYASDPSKILEKLKNSFHDVKMTIVGYSLMLDFDNDGWVSTNDLVDTLMNLYRVLKEIDYIDYSKKLYKSAIDKIKFRKRSTLGKYRKSN